MKKLVIDVGANKGDFSLDIIARNPTVRVLAIEPIPKLCSGILERAEKLGVNENIEVLECAVDTEEREAHFNVADHADLGVSSLLSFAESDIRNDVYWNVRDDLYFDKTIPVHVRRLDNILKERSVDNISFIKIDAQGLDVNVLQSLGEYLLKTDAGMLEVPSTLSTRLYIDEQYDLQRALNYLDEMGFKPYAIKPNDHSSNEFNVFFCKKEISPNVVEENLSLHGIPLYDGKHFWHAPSSQYKPVQEMDVESLLEKISQLDKKSQYLESESVKHKARAQLAEQKLDIFYNSLSWKLTKPLRMLKRLVR